MQKKICTAKTSPRPVLKWAGGKRWFVSQQSDLIPKRYNRYIEPFAGSAAVFFYCLPSNAILSDTNSKLISMYEALKNDWKRVYRHLRKHSINHSDDYYYQVRRSQPRNIYTGAARFIYLNRTCWNGLYRVNLRGEFNVPRGTKDSVLLADDDFSAISEALENTALRCTDFEVVIDEAQRGDFLFVDPPYTVRHNLNGFVKYNEVLFSWRDQERLRNAVARAKGRGVQILMTNANHKSIRSLYSEGFETRAVSRYSAISSNGAGRSRYGELVIV